MKQSQNQLNHIVCNRKFHMLKKNNKSPLPIQYSNKHSFESTDAMLTPNTAFWPAFAYRFFKQVLSFHFLFCLLYW